MAKVSKDDAVQWYAQNRGLYKKLSEKIHNILLELLEESAITIHVITNRAKEIDSFKNKINNPKYDDPLNQITDLSGVRIIAYVEDDLQPISKIIEEAFDIDTENSGDKAIELGTDKVGYKSIHYIAKIKENRSNLPEYKKFKDLKFEIQIRTILQHAWAEIEHDKNYKFNGVLPTDIKRRFKILAGTLELVDRGFNELSKEIDKISNSVSEADQKDQLSEIPISSTTLKQFLNNRFQKNIDDGIIEPSFYEFDDLIIKELELFGVKNLAELDKIIPKNFSENLVKAHSLNETATFVGIIRDLMIINDSEKYFKDVWQNNWGRIDNEAINFYRQYGIDIDEIIDRYKLTVM